VWFISISDQPFNHSLTCLKITKCISTEVQSLSDHLSSSTLESLSKYRPDPCVHSGSTSASDCIERLVGSKNLKKLFVASQDKELRKKFRNIPAVPLIYFKHGIMTLEPPSESTLIKAERVLFR
jgi:U3 small nucleolar RNA-associated protein 23